MVENLEKQTFGQNCPKYDATVQKTSGNYLPCNTLGWFPCIKSYFFFVIFCSILFLEYWLILCQIKIFYSNLFLILQSNYLLELLFHLLLLLRNICWVRLNRNWLSWFGRNQNLLWFLEMPLSYWFITYICRNFPFGSKMLLVEDL